MECINLMELLFETHLLILKKSIFRVDPYDF